MAAASLDGRRFRSVVEVAGGEVDADTEFTWAWESRVGAGTSAVEEVR